MGVDSGHAAVQDRVQETDLQPASTVTALQLAVDENAIRIDGRTCWLYAVVDPETNELLYVRPFPTTPERAISHVLVELHRRHRLDDVAVCVDDLAAVLAADGSDFEVMRRDSRNGIEHIFYNTQHQTLWFSNSFGHVATRRPNRGSKASASLTTHAELDATGVDPRPLDPGCSNNSGPSLRGTDSGNSSETSVQHLCSFAPPRYGRVCHENGHTST